MAENAFSLLHPSLQKMLYKMKWTQLRPIQVNTIYSVFHTEKNLILSAHTAGGKTEAAFLPILSKIIENKTDGLGVIYVGPLKALINDQFERLEKLCELAKIPVFKWHGDVPSSKKIKFLKNPSGILLITPESIESIFINHSTDVQKLFGNLFFIVIDELHSFIGTERGAHLKSLISRISSRNSKNVRIIALSATLGNIDSVRKWLLPDNVEFVDIITDSSEKKEIKFLIKGYICDKIQEKQNKESPCLELLSQDIVHYFYGKTALLFINSRAMLEFYTDYFDRYLEDKNLMNLFRIHHGSLSKEEREETENELKSGKPTVAFCSSTLELGIDVGDVSRVGQIGCPWSVSSLIQRLGRSGRKENEPSIMIVFIKEAKVEDSSIVERLYPTLLKGVAMTELMLEGWCEPPNENRIHYSTLIHQILSIITERGGIYADKLFNELVVDGPFSAITEQDFIELLRTLKNYDLVDQNPQGLIFLGLKGESIVRNYEFYSVFSTPREMNVIHKGKKIGSVMSVPDIESDRFLILAGKRWKIITADFKRGEIIVEPSKGGSLPVFFGGCEPDIHNKVREKMYDVLNRGEIPEYLDETAKDMLAYAQQTAKNAGLFETNIIQIGQDTYWFTWTGSAKHRTLLALGEFFGDLKVEDELIALKFYGVNPLDLKNTYKKIVENMPSEYEIAEKFSNREYEKYDKYLPERLKIESYANNQIDMNIQDLLQSLDKLE